MSTSVIEAQRALANAERAAAAERRTELTERLRVVRAELREKREAFDSLKKQVDAAAVAKENLQKQIDVYSTAIGMSLEQRPAIAAFLPDDAEVTEWQRKHSALEAERDRLVGQRNALPNVERLRFEGVTAREAIVALSNIEENVLRQLDGSFGVQPGGMFAV